ncbi:TPA: AraC family transcriptional regulator, partial [Clostridioides difficile]|nr:AraC family transcriptional regulator [Clostridioides difficile]
YFVTIPAHKFLHIKNYESNGYWDFWQKQNLIPGQDYETICGLLDSIKGKLDDDGGSEVNCGSGQIMAYINDPNGRLCDWGIPRVECWGVRLPLDYNGEIPPQMYMVDIPEAEYIVFEHGAFNYEQENCSVEEKIEQAMKNFDYTSVNYRLDTSPGRIMYFYYNPEKYFKYVRPVKKLEKPQNNQR